MAAPRPSLLQHRLYSWSALGEHEKKQIVRGGLPDDITKPRYFLHMGVLFDSTHFTKWTEDGWYTDGGPVHIRMRGKALEVGVKLYGEKVLQVRPATSDSPEPHRAASPRTMPDPAMRR